MEQGQTIRNILSQREDFLIIGLTGRMGSGCSKVAEVLATPYEEMKFPHPIPQNGQKSLSEEERTLRILAEYAESHWVKFDVIRVGAVIASFILNNDSAFLFDLSRGGSQGEREDCQKKFRSDVLKDCYIETAKIAKKYNLLHGEQKDDFILESLDGLGDKEKGLFTQISQDCYLKKLATDSSTIKLKNAFKTVGERIKELIPTDTICNFFDEEKEESFCKAVDSQRIFEQAKVNMNDLFRNGLERNATVNRKKYLEYADDLLTILAIYCMIDLLDRSLQKKFLDGETNDKGDVADTFWCNLSKINRSVDPNANEEGKILQIQKFVFVKYFTPWLGSTVRTFVTSRLGDDAYARLFQRYGQMIRYYGCMQPYGEEIQEGQTTNSKEKQDIFAIPRKINQYIKVLRHPFDSKEHRPVRIVVDSIKNIFEAVYLRYRYSAFYLWAITTDGTIREQRLHNKHLTDFQIQKLEWNEYPDQGGEVIDKIDKILAGKESASWKEIYDAIMNNTDVTEAEADFYLDSIVNPLHSASNSESLECYVNKIEDFNSVRRDFFRDGSYVFYTQDIDGCVSNADVYLFNNARDMTDAENNVKLLQAVVRNVSLVMYPGLVCPTPIERCMQIAFSAKVNSGCLSRQVGAVVTDSQYNILAIGWNDVPCGEVSCVYKNVDDISSYADQDAYSEYELHNSNFRDRLAKIQMHRSKLQGLPLSYCFKDIHMDRKEPMRSRAMHTEEKALALCGREAEGGYLFTTSSPCEMCSKNAKNHKIKKIYYLEAYPGISQAQYTNSGDKSNRAELILFSGAVGRAYMQMYTPLLPHKDVLKYLGVIEKNQRNKNTDDLA